MAFTLYCGYTAEFVGTWTFSYMFIHEICARLGYYTASCGNCLPTFRDVGKELPRDAV